METALACGASPVQLDGAGIPDILCGYQGRTLLWECKTPQKADGTGHVGKGGEGSELTAAQLRWWAAWKGAPVAFVRTRDDVLRELRLHWRSDHDGDGPCAGCAPVTLADVLAAAGAPKPRGARRRR